MNNIIFVTISMRGGGTERVISILANRMVEMGYSVTIVMIADPTIEYTLDERIDTVCVSKPTGGSFLERMKRIRNLRKVFGQNQNARIISMGTVANLFTLVSTLGLSGNITISERNDPNRLNHRPIKKYEIWIRNILYRRADKVVLQTEDVLQCFPDAIRKKSVIIPNPVPAEMPIPAPIEKREKKIIAVGRLIVEKNHKLLIDAFAEFHRQFPDYVLNVYGQGELEQELQRQIEDLHLQNNVSLCGFCNNIYDILGMGGIFVLSSDSEGLSNTLLEALAMGIPTIATDCPVGGSRVCIRNGENGFIIPVKDKDALVQKLTQLASDIELRKRLSKNAMRIREDFSEDRIVSRWLK